MGSIGILNYCLTNHLHTNPIPLGLLRSLLPALRCLVHSKFCIASIPTEGEIAGGSNIGLDARGSRPRVVALLLTWFPCTSKLPDQPVRAMFQVVRSRNK